MDKGQTHPAAALENEASTSKAVDPVSENNKMLVAERQMLNRFVGDIYAGKSLNEMSPAMRQWWWDRY